jgi:hypothetical protein
MNSMRKLLLVAGLIAMTAVPAMASAATRCEQHQADKRVAGTVIGAIAGGILGNAIGRGGGRAGGTAIGAVGGAVVGNQLARSNNACPDGYDAYDDHNGPAYRDPAAYYGSDRDEDIYFQRHGRHSDGYIRYQDDMARDARSYAHDTGSYASDDRSWRNSNGQLCSWRDDAYRGDDGNMNHRWIQDCR